MNTVEIIGHVGNYARAVRMACEEKGIPYTVTRALPQTPEVQALHPFGKIPILRHDGFVLCESKAIVDYLDHLSPERPLIPTEPVAAALTEQWISLVNDVIDQTMIRDYVLSYVRARIEERAPNRAVIDAALPGIEKQLGVLDKAVADTGYLVGQQLTFADLNLMAILSALRDYPEGSAALERWPRVLGYFQRHAERESFRRTAAN
jgi:glutathione S-transferase